MEVSGDRRAVPGAAFNARSSRLLAWPLPQRLSLHR
jgi:hypothetical protein